jgi:hypothetical protein
MHCFRRHSIEIGLEADVEHWSPDASTRQQILHDLRRPGGGHPATKPVSCLCNGTCGARDGSFRTARLFRFPERSGQYWGKPADDVAAIEELERQRRAGASFIVFAWPALWWLEYYSGLHQYLRSRYSCVLENERLQGFPAVIFTL